MLAFGGRGDDEGCVAQCCADRGRVEKPPECRSGRDFVSTSGDGLRGDTGNDLVDGAVRWGNDCGFACGVGRAVCLEKLGNIRRPVFDDVPV